MRSVICVYEPKGGGLFHPEAMQLVLGSSPPHETDLDLGSISWYPRESPNQPRDPSSAVPVSSTSGNAVFAFGALVLYYNLIQAES